MFCLEGLARWHLFHCVSTLLPLLLASSWVVLGLSLRSHVNRSGLSKRCSRHTQFIQIDPLHNGETTVVHRALSLIFFHYHLVHSAFFSLSFFHHLSPFVPGLSSFFFFFSTTKISISLFPSLSVRTIRFPVFSPRV